ncbi:unnamed protein product, partial [Symbiodinium necroappetens]
ENAAERQELSEVTQIRAPSSRGVAFMSARPLLLAGLFAWLLRICHGNADLCWAGVPDDVRDLCCKSGKSSCFTPEFTFELCCQGAQASSVSKSTQAPPHLAFDRNAACFEEGYMFTYRKCCESADDLKIFVADGGCFEHTGKYTYLKCCLDLPELEQWIHVDEVKGSPTSDFYQIRGTLYMTEQVKQRFRRSGGTLPPATLGGVSHADVHSPCLKSFLYDSRYQLLPMWSGRVIFPPPPKDINVVIKFRTRMREAVECWGDAECHLYMVKLDWYSVEHHRFEGAYMLSLPVTCNLGEAAVTVIPLISDRRIYDAAILGGATFQRVREGDVCVAPPRAPGVLAMCAIVCALSLAPFLYCRFWRQTSSDTSASKAKAPSMAVDILRLLAAWIVVDTHRRQPFPFKWPICDMTGTDMERLEDVFVVLTVRLVSMHSLTLQSFAMKVVRKVAVQASTQIAFTHLASFFVRPPSPWYCGQKLFFEDEQPAGSLAGWLEWMLGAATMRDFAIPDSNNFDSGMVWPAYPADDFPNPAWPTSTWFVCLEYSIFWFVGAAIAIESVLPHIVPAATTAYIAWMFVDLDRQPQMCFRDYYHSLRYCRLPSTMLTHCACRALARLLGPTGYLRQRWTPLVIAAIGGALALSTPIESHAHWETFGFGEAHCRQHLPFMVAGLPFQLSLLLFTFLDIQLPAAAASWLRYLANLNFCIMASHLWILMFFDKHAPEYVSAWSSVRNDAEGSLFATHQLIVIFGVAALLHALVAKPVQLMVRGVARYPSLAPPLAFTHLALCLLTWPRNFSHYPLFTYGDKLPGAASSAQ